MHGGAFFAQRPGIPARRAIFEVGVIIRRARPMATFLRRDRVFSTFPNRFGEISRTERGRAPGMNYSGAFA